MIEREAARREIRELHAKRERGDLTGRRFLGRLAEATVALFRAAARETLDDGERILAEHHVARGHIRIARSVLDDPEDEAISLFVTDRSLVRVQALIPPAGEAALDPVSVTRVDRVPLAAVHALHVRHEIRWSEVAAGTAIALFAWLAAPWLLFTGTMMLLLGLAGIVHGLLLPATWVEVELRPPVEGPPIILLKRLRKSGRAMRRRLAAAAATGGSRAEAVPRRKDESVSDDRDEGRENGACNADFEDGPPWPRPTTRSTTVRPTRALLVDDDDAFRQALVKVLGRRAIEVTCAPDGETGLAMAADGSFDVVVLDLAMPGLDGLEVLARLRARGGEVPVIILTGHGTPAAGLDAIDLGAVDFLLKPVSPDRLALAIETAARPSAGAV